MAKQDSETHTPHRPVRIPPMRWERFGELTGKRDRSRVINEFIAWFNGEPGAELPEPPDTPIQRHRPAGERDAVWILLVDKNGEPLRNFEFKVMRGPAPANDEAAVLYDGEPHSDR